MSYSEFDVTSGQTVTVLISPEGNGTMNNAWLNGFEIDGGDPFKGVSNIYPVDKNKHLDAETALSWKAGTGAVSHDVYIGTDRDSVYDADKNTPEYKGNQTGTSFKLMTAIHQYLHITGVLTRWTQAEMWSRVL